MKNGLIFCFCIFLFWGCATKTTSVEPSTTTNATNKETKITTETTGDYIVKGKNYIGAPTEEVSRSGCEGCGERGSFEFSQEGNRVSFIWGGSDIMDGGTYEQTGNKLTITSMYGNVYEFEVSKDGKEITDLQYKTIFRDKNYPWK